MPGLFGKNKAGAKAGTDKAPPQLAPAGNDDAEEDYGVSLDYQYDGYMDDEAGTDKAQQPTGNDNETKAEGADGAFGEDNTDYSAVGGEYDHIAVGDYDDSTIDNLDTFETHNDGDDSVAEPTASRKCFGARPSNKSPSSEAPKEASRKHVSFGGSKESESGVATEEDDFVDKDPAEWQDMDDLSEKESDAMAAVEETANESTASTSAASLSALAEEAAKAPRADDLQEQVPATKGIPEGQDSLLTTGKLPAMEERRSEIESPLQNDDELVRVEESTKPSEEMVLRSEERSDQQKDDAASPSNSVAMRGHDEGSFSRPDTGVQLQPTSTSVAHHASLQEPATLADPMQTPNMASESPAEQNKEGLPIQKGGLFQANPAGPTKRAALPPQATTGLEQTGAKLGTTQMMPNTRPAPEQQAKAASPINATADSSPFEARASPPTSGILFNGGRASHASSPKTNSNIPPETVLGDTGVLHGNQRRVTAHLSTRPESPPEDLGFDGQDPTQMDPERAEGQDSFATGMSGEEKSQPFQQEARLGMAADSTEQPRHGSEHFRHLQPQRPSAEFNSFERHQSTSKNYQPQQQPTRDQMPASQPMTSGRSEPSRGSPTEFNSFERQQQSTSKNYQSQQQPTRDQMRASQQMAEGPKQIHRPREADIARPMDSQMNRMPAGPREAPNLAVLQKRAASPNQPMPSPTAANGTGAHIPPGKLSDKQNPSAQSMGRLASAMAAKRGSFSLSANKDPFSHTRGQAAQNISPTNVSRDGVRVSVPPRQSPMTTISPSTNGNGNTNRPIIPALKTALSPRGIEFDSTRVLPAAPNRVSLTGQERPLELSPGSPRVSRKDLGLQTGTRAPPVMPGQGNYEGLMKTPTAPRNTHIPNAEAMDRSGETTTPLEAPRASVTPGPSTARKMTRTQTDEMEDTEMSSKDDMADVLPMDLTGGNERVIPNEMPSFATNHANFEKVVRQLQEQHETGSDQLMDMNVIFFESYSETLQDQGELSYFLSKLEALAVELDEQTDLYEEFLSGFPDEE